MSGPRSKAPLRPWPPLGFAHRRPPATADAVTHFARPSTGRFTRTCSAALPHDSQKIWCRFTTTDRYSARFTADAAPIRLSISRSIFPSFVNKTPRYLNFSTRSWPLGLSFFKKLIVRVAHVTLSYLYSYAAIGLGYCRTSGSIVLQF
jgi:hypothetical protein